MGNQLLSIPEYFTAYIDKSIDLSKTPKICCPFHHEDTPSFSYSEAKGVWRCFGACKAGGDVVELHRKNYRLRNRREAEDSLYKLLGLSVAVRRHRQRTGTLDEQAAAHKAAYAKAVMLAETIDDWNELDYIMGQYPVDTNQLEAFYNCRKK